MVGKKTPYDIATCSTLCVIAGVSHWQTQNELLDQAIKAHNGEQPEQWEQTITQRMGDVLEPELIREAGRMLGLKSVEVDIEEPIKHDDLPIWGSLDGLGFAENLSFTHKSHNWLLLPEQEEITLDGWGVIECKCTRDYGRDDIEDERGVLQAKALMECSNYNWAAVIVLWQSTDFRIYLYERKQEFNNRLAKWVLDFDRRVKEKDYYPPVTSADANIVYPVGEDGVVELNKDLLKHVARIQNNKEEIKRLTEEIDESETLIKEDMKSKENAVIDSFSIKWPTIKYKAQPEKIVPAKDARISRGKSLRIKENK